jgi:hypothetical protein
MYAAGPYQPLLGKDIQSGVSELEPHLAATIARPKHGTTNADRSERTSPERGGGNPAMDDPGGMTGFGDHENERPRAIVGPWAFITCTG